METFSIFPQHTFSVVPFDPSTDAYYASNYKIQTKVDFRL